MKCGWKFLKHDFTLNTPATSLNPMEYDEWQQEVLDAKGHVLLNKGRQIGGTQIFAIKAAEYIINNPKHQI